MYYVIMDLEWNNTYGRKIKGFINEIIEIGAVMLDENFNQIETFSTLIKAQIGKKLRGKVKELTNLTNDDLSSGVEFTKAISAIKKWVGGREAVFLTWGDGDVRVLIDNCRYLNGCDRIPFLQYYANLQNYFQFVMKTPSSKQVGLSAAAEMLELDISKYEQHRALDDSLIEADCFKKIFNKKLFERYVSKCDQTYYEKLQFKPYVISNIKNPLVDQSKLDFICEECNQAAERISEWCFAGRTFRALYYCKGCKKKFRVSVGFKKLYDRVEVKKTSSALIDEETDEQKIKMEQSFEIKQNEATS